MAAVRTTPCFEEQVHDLEKVVKLWSKLGLAPRRILTYCHWTLQLLRTAQARDYRDLCADRVVRLALSFALRHRHQSPERTRQSWLAAFRAFAWGLEQLGTAVGSVNLPRKTQESDPVILAFVQY